MCLSSYLSGPRPIREELLDCHAATTQRNLVNDRAKPHQAPQQTFFCWVHLGTRSCCSCIFVYCLSVPRPIREELSDCHAATTQPNLVNDRAKLHQAPQQTLSTTEHNRTRLPAHNGSSQSKSSQQPFFCVSRRRTPVCPPARVCSLSLSRPISEELGHGGTLGGRSADTPD